MIGIVSRIDAHQKGFHLLVERVEGKTLIEHFVEAGAQFVIAGIGTGELEEKIQQQSFCPHARYSF